MEYPLTIVEAKTVNLNRLNPCSNGIPSDAKTGLSFEKSIES